MNKMIHLKLLIFEWLLSSYSIELLALEFNRVSFNFEEKNEKVLRSLFSISFSELAYSICTPGILNYDLELN